jgi:hypothetical protein
VSQGRPATLVVKGTLGHEAGLHQQSLSFKPGEG